MMLAQDARNFHGWMYRRMVVGELERVEGESHARAEWEYTSAVLRAGGGLRNYSAWWRRGGLMREVVEGWQEGADLLEDELELVKKGIVTDTGDQSLWLHYRGLVGENCRVGEGEGGMEWGMRWGLLREEIEWVRELEGGSPGCKEALVALVAFVRLLRKVRRERDAEDDELDDEIVDEGKEGRELKEWVETLIRIDPMRKGRYEDLRELL